MTDSNMPLSPEGSRRRAAIIEVAGQALDERVRRRRARRATGAALTLACAGLALLVANNMRPRAEVVDKKPSNERACTIINDDELVTELRNAGIVAGVARIGDEVHLVASDGKVIKPPLRWIGSNES